MVIPEMNLTTSVKGEGAGRGRKVPGGNRASRLFWAWNVGKGERSDSRETLMYPEHNLDIQVTVFENVPSF